MGADFKKLTEFYNNAEKLLLTDKTMKDIFNYIVNENKSRVAVKYINENGKIKKYKYKTVKKNAFKYAGVLFSLLKGKGKNQPIVLKIPNNPHWPELFWAILMCGYKPLLVDAKATKEGTQNLIEQSKAVAIICDDINKYDIPKFVLDDFVEEKEFTDFKEDWENEVIFCSSGTTGNVKLMVFNGENLISQICCSLDMPKETKDIMYPKSFGKCNILAMIPFHHIFGFVAVFLWYTFYGKTLVFPASNTPTDIQTMCVKGKVTHVYSVPLFWDSLAQGLYRKAEMQGEDKVELVKKIISYNLGGLSKEDADIAAKPAATKILQKSLLGTKIRFCISGGGYLSEETAKTINGVGYPLHNGYGMTEIGVVAVDLSNNIQERIKANIGHPFHGVDFKIGENNELLIKSDTVHVKEIIGGEIKETKLDKEGYFASGDISEQIENNFAIKGRMKDVIINADGENIFPEELEIILKKMPHVVNYSIMGVKFGKAKREDITLVLELENSVDDYGIAEIQEFVSKAKFPHNTKIDKIFLAKKRLPLANNMKVKRFEIKKDIENKSENYVEIGSKREQRSFEGFDKKEIASILKIVRNEFSKVLILPVFKISDEAHWINDLGGDSMCYVELAQKLESLFNITFDEELLGKMATINDFVYEIAKIKKAAKEKQNN